MVTETLPGKPWHEQDDGIYQTTQPSARHNNCIQSDDDPADTTNDNSHEEQSSQPPQSLSYIAHHL